MNEPTIPMPVVKRPEADKKREAMIAAAQAYDEVQRELASLKEQLHTAVAGLEAKNSEIGELKKMLDHWPRQFEATMREMSDRFDAMLQGERANAEIASKARDQAYAERSDALAWLSSIEAVIERARDTGGLQAPVRRRRNGKHADPGFVAADPDLGTPGGNASPGIGPSAVADRLSGEGGSGA